MCLAHLKNRADACTGRVYQQIFLEKSLRQPEHHHQQIRDPLTRLRTHRYHADRRSEIGYAIVSVRAESIFVELPDQFIQLLVEFLLHMRNLLLVPFTKRRILVGLPAVYAIDLVCGNNERGFGFLQNIQRFDRLRQESLVDVDCQHRKVRKRATAAAQSRE